MRVAIASIEAVPEYFRDNELLIDALRARGAHAETLAWDSQSADWRDYDSVVIRSTWDYTWRRDEFVAWAEAVGERLHNRPELVRWNTDKRYLADLASAGLPVVETTYVQPGEDPPPLHGEVVVKPSVSGGGRNTGRFTGDSHAGAADLIRAIGISGKTAMIQPYLGSVDEAGEAALVFVDGRFSHGLRKRAVLRSEGIAPTRDDAIGAAEAMYDPGLVAPADPGEDELALAAAVVDELARRFAGAPLYTRVDIARRAGGEPVLMELEAVEPNLYLGLVPEAAGRLADAILALPPARLRGRR